MIVLGRYQILTGFLLFLIIPFAWADFEIRNNNGQADYYGKGQTGTFRKAITGGDPLTREQQAELDKALPMREDKHFYVRFRFNQGSYSFNGIKNRSTGINAGVNLAKQSQSKRQTGLEAAVGYIWSPSLRMDIEYLINRNFQYAVNPAFVGVTAQSLTSEIKNNTFLANIYYDITGFSRFLPYVTAGVGLSSNSVKSTLTPGGNKTEQSFNLAWSVGLGLRIGFLSRWYLDAGYRYMGLAQGLKIRPTSDTKLMGNYNLSAVSVGVNFLF